jgi:hypothetical protein
VKHPDHVEGWEGKISDLAHAIGRMRYDKVVEFLDCLAREFYRQEKGDVSRGRHKLAAELLLVAVNIDYAKDHVEQAWEICKTRLDIP